MSDGTFRGRTADEIRGHDVMKAIVACILFVLLIAWSPMCKSTWAAKEASAEHTTESEHATPTDNHAAVPESTFEITKPEGTELLPGEHVVAGKGTPGDKITLKVNGAEVGQVTVAEDGTWSWPVQFVAGTAELVAMDSHEKATLRSYVVGTPAVAEAEPAANEQPTTIALSVTNPVEEAELSNGPLTIEGTAPAGSKVTIIRNGKPLAEVVAGPDGKWSSTNPHYAKPTEYRAKIEATGEEVIITTKS